ncbi:protein translocase subunit SecD [Sphingomonas cannabina]|uniref:protein translocase subunit SecD n=1 Tax=Sphingomonas cannabina TaxID=2899123 RepID=UPI001F2C5534|nr:protein translocase subunit SecD [Sphingomonas cannabina]UIJ45043.1 protein translocase subunit SecD [Sphingomonas cannabina]
MLDFPRWKITGIVGVLLIAVLLAIPSLLPERIVSQSPVNLPRINLGLDLAGGSYLLLEADTNDVAAAKIETMRDQIATEMRRGNPTIAIGDISGRDGKLSFMVRDPSQVDAARERLLGIVGSGVGMTGQREWDVEVVDSTRFVLTPTKAGLAQEVDRAMSVATEVVRRRIDELGTREPTIIRQGTDRIVVQVPGLQDPQALKDLLGKTAKLEFKLVDVNADPQQVAQGIAPIGDVILPFADDPSGQRKIALKRSTVISGDQLADARQEFDQQNGQPVVAITFNGEGGRRFARVTQENVNKPFAIIVDNQVISAPNIDEAIMGGRAQIRGGFSVQSANELAIALRSGKLPVDLKVVDESTVGPDLGQDSIRAGILASAVAAAAVVAFMLVTYGRFGVYANLAVIINVFVILAAMAIISATLTLPGIAGFVLTIGTAVDANVLINERIREERRRGRSVVQAVELGYKEASRTIFEANMTHAISGLVMLLMGSGPVKGFAVVLLIGIATSVFTAVTFTRMLVALWIRKNRPTDINI